VEPGESPVAASVLATRAGSGTGGETLKSRQV